MAKCSVRFTKKGCKVHRNLFLGRVLKEISVKKLVYFLVILFVAGNVFHDKCHYFQPALRSKVWCKTLFVLSSLHNVFLENLSYKLLLVRLNKQRFKQVEPVCLLRILSKSESAAQFKSVITTVEGKNYVIGDCGHIAKSLNNKQLEMHVKPDPSAVTWQWLCLLFLALDLCSGMLFFCFYSLY